MNTLDGKVILVTGAGRGLGAAICKTLSEARGTIILADIQKEGMERTLQEISGNQGCQAKSFLLDVGNEQQITEVVGRIKKEFGKLDIVVNNAGVDITKSIEELLPEEWDRVMNVNLRGPFLISRAALPFLRRNGEGHIVNIVSTASKRAWANASAYHASKWGLLGFSHALHVEARQVGVKVTAVIAGGMHTPFLLERFPDIDRKTLQDPRNVADTVRYVLTQPRETVIPEVMVIPMGETSWP